MMKKKNIPPLQWKFRRSQEKILVGHICLIIDILLACGCMAKRVKMPFCLSLFNAMKLTSIYSKYDHQMKYCSFKPYSLIYQSHQNIIKSNVTYLWLKMSVQHTPDRVGIGNWMSDFNCLRWCSTGFMFCFLNITNMINRKAQILSFKPKWD